MIINENKGCKFNDWQISKKKERKNSKKICTNVKFNIVFGKKKYIF